MKFVAVMQMDQAQRLKLRLELLWWVFTFVVVIAILSPLFINRVVFPLLWINMLFIIIFITFARYIFLLKHTLWARKLWPKILVVGLSLWLVFVIATGIGDFNNYVEEQGLQTIVDHLPPGKQYGMIRYIQSEAIFFGVGSAVATILFPVRMLMSIWRTRNTPDKV